MFTYLRWLLFLLAWLAATSVVHAASLALSIADISADTFSARDVRLTFPPGGGADLTLGELSIQGRMWRNLGLHCAHFDFDGRAFACQRGSLLGKSAVSLEFNFDLLHQQLELSLKEGVESWLVTAEFGTPRWKIAMDLHHAQAKRLADFWPASMPQPSQGRLDGTFRASGDAAGLRSLESDIQLSELAFSDAAGLHAAEGLAGRLQVYATNSGGRWAWKGNLEWQGGELFWQPLYLRGGHRLQAAGTVNGDHVEITQATANLAEVGEFKLAGIWNDQSKSLESCDLQGQQIALGPLFASWIKPLLEKSALATAELSGYADVDWRYRAGATESLNFNLYDAGIADSEHHYGLRGVNAAIPWQANAETQANIRWVGGELLKVPLGATQLTITMRGLELTLAAATLPILDGALSLRDFHLHQEDDDWHWSFAGNLAPISMRPLSRALGVPEMHGTLSGMIPQVSYVDGVMRVDGALLFRVFDGTIVANQLQLHDAFGRAPRLSGNLDMRGLDLDLLTRTFSFGNIQGKLDVSVNDLELANWQPVRFDAKVASSPGSYRKKISQKAVENISSLGGSGATAALQRSFLRVFENFGYNEIGLSCVLRNGVCQMGGVANSKDGYVIVQGGGIPAITVMGYNRAVGWDELLARLKRVMQDNVQAVVK